jgi:hypothetical protein
VGADTVTVTSAGVVTNGLTFTVTAGSTLTSVSPVSGVQGTNVPVTLTGTNFAANSTVNVSGSGITVSNVQVVSTTQITATFAIATNATTGADTVTVTSAGVATNGVTFTVTAPTLTSISPVSGVQGTNVPVTLTGTNFAPNSTVSVSDSGVTVSNVQVVSTTQITATFGITSNAIPGADTVTVTSAGVVTNGVTFTVTAAPTLISINPASGAQGTNVPVTLAGTNFAANSTVNVSGSGITVSNVQVLSATQITATFGITANATPGADTVTVTSAGATTNGVTFTVTAAPTLASISPASGVLGTNVPVTLTGTNFASNSTVNVSGSGITVSNVQVVSATQITATFGIATNATPGADTVTVTSAGLITNGVTFTVTVPTLISISPVGGVQGMNVPVTLTGTNFAPNATVNVSDSGVTVSNVQVVSATQITATFGITSNSIPGVDTVTVTSAGVVTNGVTFTVTAVPTLISINPASGAQGTNVPVTLTGTNFAASSTVNVSGSGITVSNVQVVSATQITATLTIASNAALGGYTVSVTSAGVTSNGVTFTTVPPPPVLSSLSPASGGAGNSVPVTLTGANFLPGATLSSTNSSLSFSNVNVVSSTQMTATFTLASNAVAGSAPVTVTTSYGTSNAVGYTIQSLFTPIRVDAGSKQPYTDALGQVWSADSGFTGGSLLTINHAIFGTPAPALYQTLHYSFSTMSYQATVPNGQYTVNLKFEENQVNQAGKRLFNVVLNGQQVLTNFDEYAAAGAQYQAVDEPLPATVTNGAINLQFVPVVNATGVYAIEIVAGTPPTPTVSSITPDAGAPGSAVPVTITGTNLLSDVVVNAGPNITVNNVVVVSATEVTATFSIAAAAAPGQVNVTLTTNGGTTAPTPFTVQ